MKARYPGECVVCHHPIQRGMEIADSGVRGPKGGKKMGHVECLGGARRNPRRTRRNTSGLPKGYSFDLSFLGRNPELFLHERGVYSAKVIGRVEGGGEAILPKGLSLGSTLVVVGYDGKDYRTYLVDEEEPQGRGGKKGYSRKDAENNARDLLTVFNVPSDRHPAPDGIARPLRKNPRMNPERRKTSRRRRRGPIVRADHEVWRRIGPAKLLSVIRAEAKSEGAQVKLAKSSSVPRSLANAFLVGSRSKGSWGFLVADPAGFELMRRVDNGDARASSALADLPLKERKRLAAIDPEDVDDAYLVSSMMVLLAEKNPRRNAGRRTSRGAPKPGRLPALPAYASGDSDLFGVGSKDLARMGTPAAVSELRRRGRDADGVKLAWKR